MELGQPARSGRAPAEGRGRAAGQLRGPADAGGRALVARALRAGRSGSSGSSRSWLRRARAPGTASGAATRAWRGLPSSVSSAPRRIPTRSSCWSRRRWPRRASSTNAFRLYREALEKRPGLAEAHEALARIYEQTGHPDWAAVERERSRADPAARLPIAEPARATSARGGTRRSSRPPQPLATAEGLYWRSRAANELAREAFGRLDRAAAVAGGHVAAGRGPARPPAASRRGDRGAEEGGGGLARRPPDPPRAGRARSSWPTTPRRRGRSWKTCCSAIRTPRSWRCCWARRGSGASQPGKAVPLLERAVARDPKLLPAQAALGRAYLEAGETAKAIAPLKAALETDRDGSLHYQLARAYRATGRADLASQALAAIPGDAQVGRGRGAEPAGGVPDPAAQLMRSLGPRFFKSR